MTRFLADASGTYDLASISAITAGGAVRETKDAQPVQHAILRTEGGDALSTQTPYAVAVAAWTAYLEPADEAAPAPAAAPAKK